MIFAYLLVFYAVNTDAKEGGHCTKEGVTGVCTNIRKCPAAQQDIENRIAPQLCEFTSLEPIVCCTSSGPVTERPQNNNCILPPYPEHGTYVTNLPNSKPGEGYSFVTINITCHRGYGIDGPRSMSCQDGRWRDEMPKCVSACHLPPHPSVVYMCIVPDGEEFAPSFGYRPCREYEPHGTFVSPRCHSPHYYSPTPLSFMHCIGGSWDYVAKCAPECGTVTPDDTKLVLNGKPVKRGEAPWHAGIYKKTMEPYEHIYCGGSLISPGVIISAAHCFWSFIDGKQPESNYGVAVGKLYRPWNVSDETEQAQYSDVKEIHLPVHFKGVEVNFQDNIAVVTVSTPFVLNKHIRPVCLDFDYIFERRQLQPGNKGKIAGWGLTKDNGDSSPVLKVIELAYVGISTCISEWPNNIVEHITTDKICAAQDVTDGLIALSKGDSGGGYVFPESDKSTSRYFLRGVIDMVISSCGADKTPCNTKTYIGFTHVSQHENFIKQFWGMN